MIVALAGATGSGKTVYFSSLEASYKTMRSVPRVRDPHLLEKIEKERISERVLFCISRYKREEDENLLAGWATGLRKTPMEYPGSTLATDYFPVEYLLRRAKLDGSRFIEKRIWVEFSDTAGGTLAIGDLKRQRYVDTVSAIKNANSLIVFIPCDRLANEHHQNVKDLLFSLVLESARVFEFSRTILPVSIVLTKADMLDERLKTDFFKDIIIPTSKMISKRHNRIRVMACPISSESRKFKREYEAQNIEFPILFSLIGAYHQKAVGSSESIHGHHVSDRTHIENSVDLASDRAMMNAICDTIYTSSNFPNSFLFFFEDGQEISILDLKDSL